MSTTGYLFLGLDDNGESKHKQAAPGPWHDEALGRRFFVGQGLGKYFIIVSREDTDQVNQNPGRARVKSSVLILELWGRGIATEKSGRTKRKAEGGGQSGDRDTT